MLLPLLGDTVHAPVCRLFAFGIWNGSLRNRMLFTAFGRLSWHRRGLADLGPAEEQLFWRLAVAY